MAELERDAFRKMVISLRKKIERYRAEREGIGEENTKVSLITPLLEGLGWNVRDLDEVWCEYKGERQDKPVDYALLIGGRPRLFLEAKALGEDLENRKLVSQIIGYAVVAGVEWCVLTDGNEYRLYNTHARVPLEKKLFRKVSIAEEASEGLTLDTLGLLSRSALEKDLLSALWEIERVDRQVREALEGILEDAPIGLLRLIQERAPKMRSVDVRASLKRTQIEIASPVEVPVTPPKGGRKPQLGPGKRHPVTLANLIEGGALKAPVRLEKNYKGTTLRATLRRDGKVGFEGTLYNSLSTAATRAVQTVTGRLMAQDGWEFWRLKDSKTGRWKSLHTVRQAFLEAQTKQE